MKINSAIGILSAMGILPMILHLISSRGAMGILPMILHLIPCYPALDSLPPATQLPLTQ